MELYFNLILVFSCSQLIEVSGKTQDECMVALHDCNGDVNRAIDFLLESTSDTVGSDTPCTDHIIHTVASCPEIFLNISVKKPPVFLFTTVEKGSIGPHSII